MSGCLINANTLDIRGSASETGGGGLWNAEGGVATIHSSRILNNTMLSYSGGGAGVCSAGALSMHSCQVDGNAGMESAGGGGLLNLGNMLLNMSQVEFNTGWNGGGLSNGVLGGSTAVVPSLSLYHSSLAFNRANNNAGGGISFGVCSLFSCVVHGNSALSGEGGGLVNSNNNPSFCGLMELFNSVVDGNAAGRGAGGVLNNPEYDLDGTDALSCVLLLDGVNVTANSASVGAGIQNQQGGDLYMETVRVERNRIPNTSLAFAGAGLYNAGSGYMQDTVIPPNFLPEGLVGASMYNGGDLLYVLPVPRGRYLEGVFRCRRLQCYTGSTSGQSQPVVDCPRQLCPEEFDGFYVTKARPHAPSPAPAPARPPPPSCHAAACPSPADQRALFAGAGLPGVGGSRVSAEVSGGHERVGHEARRARLESLLWALRLWLRLPLPWHHPPHTRPPRVLRLPRVDRAARVWRAVHILSGRR